MKLFTTVGRRKWGLLCIAAVLITAYGYETPYKYPFLDPSLPLETRVNDLVGRMTLEEKISQMLNSAPAVERLGIPAYNWWNECLHGVARTPFHVTSYPQAIAMAATFDTAAIHQMADYTAEEGRAIYNESIRENNHDIYRGLTYWSPNINIFRDPRWGRGQETYGEDPYLTASMGKAFVRGIQGDDPRYLKAAACAKHYAVHSGPESERHEFDAEVSDYDLWDTYLPAFHALVTQAGVAGVMCAYNAYKNQPCCGNDVLMTHILRDDWHFGGYVTSDCGALEDFYTHHHADPDPESAAADAVLHGTDLECGRVTYQTLAKAVHDGKLTEKQLDVSVKRLFTIRFRLGMFDPPSMVRYDRIPITALESAPHQAEALKMARESIVLLKNQGGLLPLSKHIRKIAILGPNANHPEVQLGNYNGFPSRIITPLDGIRAKLGAATQIYYDSTTDYTTPADPASLEKVLDSVRDADVIVFVGGISPRLEGEEMKISKPGFSGGDRTSIALPAAQTTVLEKLQATGKPVVFVMMTGSALAVPWAQDHLPAIVNAWYGGQAAGTALADVLFGDYDPSGRLPVTFYKSDRDLPPFDDYSMKNRTYRYFDGKPLYPFGYGLSYTHFGYRWNDKPLASYHPDGTIRFSVRVANTGKREGEDVVQAYVSYPQGAGRLPLKELRQFARVQLDPGGSRTLDFAIPVKALQKWSDAAGGFQVTPGKYGLFVGASSEDRALTASFAVN